MSDKAAKIDRKLKKLARRMAEANIYLGDGTGRTLADFSDVFEEAWGLIRITGHHKDYEKRVKQIIRTGK